MNAIATLLKRILFLGVVIVSLTIIPVIFLAVALALFLYALAAESLHSLISGKPAQPDARAARKFADEMCRTAPQRRTSP